MSLRSFSNLNSLIKAGSHESSEKHKDQPLTSHWVLCRYLLALRAASASKIKVLPVSCALSAIDEPLERNGAVWSDGELCARAV